MTAKEKAKELVDKYVRSINESDFHIPEFISGVAMDSHKYGKVLDDETLSLAKICALIAVDEILLTVENIHKPEYVAFDIYEPRNFHLEGSESEDNLSGYGIKEYWEQVKSEIEKQWKLNSKRTSLN